MCSTVSVCPEQIRSNYVKSLFPIQPLSAHCRLAFPSYDIALSELHKVRIHTVRRVTRSWRVPVITLHRNRKPIQSIKVLSTTHSFLIDFVLFRNQEA